MRVVFVAATMILMVKSAVLAGNEPPFQLDKMADACGAAATDNAQYRNCLGVAVAKVTAKMKGNILCATQTCIIRLKCSQDGDNCSNNGFLVHYGADPAGHTVAIRLSTGKTASYFRCGTCSAVKPASDNEMPLRLMESARSLLLEIPADERGK